MHSESLVMVGFIFPLASVEEELDLFLKSGTALGSKLSQ